MKTNWLDYTLLTLVIIGAINWGLIGFGSLTVEYQEKYLQVL